MESAATARVVTWHRALVVVHYASNAIKVQRRATFGCVEVRCTLRTRTLMTKRNKLWSILFLGVAVVAMLFLSAGLSGLELLPGRPLPLGGESPKEPGPSGGSIGAEVVDVIVRVSIIIAGLLIPAALIYLIVSPEARKRVLRDLIMLLPFLLLFFVVLRNRPEFLNPAQEAQPSGPSAEFPPPSAPTAEFIANPPQWLVFGVSLILALFIAAVLVGTVWFIWRRRQRALRPLEQLALEAEEALESIQAGADLRNAVIRCYYEMSQVLSEQRGIQRQSAMTPREFESRLEEAGLPREEIRQLTRLFEKARYGAKAVDAREERQAIACLAAIAEYCRRPQ